MFNKKKVDNQQGKLEYKKTILLYKREIVSEISNNPDKLFPLLNELEMNEKDFEEALSDDSQSKNITFYDYCLSFLKEIK